MNEEDLQALRAYADGQLTATMAAIRALILLHPDPTAAAAAVEDEVELWISAALGSCSTTDAMIQGMQRAKKALLPTPQQLPRSPGASG